MVQAAWVVSEQRPDWIPGGLATFPSSRLNFRVSPVPIQTITWSSVNCSGRQCKRSKANRKGCPRPKHYSVIQAPSIFAKRNSQDGRLLSPKYGRFRCRCSSDKTVFSFSLVNVSKGV